MLSSGGVGVSGVRGGGGGGGAESDAGEAAGGGDLTLQQFLHLEREVNGRLPHRRNPGEPIILYSPWHFFFALFLEMVILGR